jgi:CubicO group peptidase (beta-lactamase class C family)
VNQKVAVLRPAPDNAANWPAGSVFSNLADLSRFVTALMDDGKLDGKQALSPKAVKAISTPHADIPGSRAKYGYGLDLEDRVWTHGGSRAGYGSFIAMLPGRHLALIVLCNRTGENLPKTRAQIMEMLGESRRDEGSGQQDTIPTNEFAKYAGSFRNGDTTVQIVERDGKLFFRSMELRKADGGWLIMRDANGKTAGRIFSVAGPDGRIEYLHIGGRSSARVM